MRHSLLKRYIIVFCFIVAAPIVAIYYIPHTIEDLILFNVAIISLIIAALAYEISLKTYTSIDAVYAISKMDGSVLENENYKTNIVYLINKYNSPSQSKTFDAVISDLEKLFKQKTSTATDLANNLQFFVDNLALLSLIHRRDIEIEKDTERINKLFKKIGKQINDLKRISSGSLILAEETFNLTKAVIQYQKAARLSQTLENSLFNVRGEMLKNATSKTIYYNYMGLYYFTKTTRIIESKMNLEGNIYSIKNLDIIQKDFPKLEESDRELIVAYLDDSKKLLSKALLHINDDTMWLAFIKYHQARVAFFTHITYNKKESWENIMNEAIMYRRKLNIMLEDILQTRDNFIIQEFKCQEYLSRCVKILFQMSCKDDISDTLSKKLYLKKDNYLGVLSSQLMKIEHHSQHIILKEHKKDIVSYVVSLDKKK